MFPKTLRNMWIAVIITIFVLCVSVLLITRGDSLGNLNRVLQYIEDNDHTDIDKAREWLQA